MRIPQQTVIPYQSVKTARFYGLDKRPGSGDAVCSDMHNLQLGTDGTLCTRGKRGEISRLEAPQGIASNGALAWVDGGTLYYDGAATPIVGLQDGEKQLINMGAYVLIFPDKKYYNTVNPEDYGEIERKWTGNQVRIHMCQVDGTEYDDEMMHVGSLPPAEIKDGMYWLDTSGEKDVLKRWSQGNEKWTVYDSVYIKLEADGIGRGVKPGDALDISGLQYIGENEKTKKQVADLNGTFEIMDCDEDWLVMVGLMDEAVELTGEICADRTCPQMDYVTEANNRLWGCYHGLKNGEMLNEIYACALGDFKNWRKFSGLALDSYIMSVGTDGDWTGAVTYRGMPYFFKERYVHKIYGEKPSNFQAQQTTCDGVRKGCAKTLQVVNGTLLYLGINGVVAFDALPTAMDDAFNGERYVRGAACEYENRYIISMQRADGAWGTYQLTTDKGTWEKTDDSHVMQFVREQDEVYMLMEDGRIMAMNGTTGEKEEGMLEFDYISGEIGYEADEKKRIRKMQIRLKMEKNARMQVMIEYDRDGIWHNVGNEWTNKEMVRAITLPILPRRCDHMRIRIKGRGMVTLYGITKQIYVGSDKG